MNVKTGIFYSWSYQRKYAVNSGIDEEIRVPTENKDLNTSKLTNFQYTPAKNFSSQK